MLIDSARKNVPLAYGEVMRAIGLNHKREDHRNQFSRILEDISRFEHSRNKRPMLSAQVLYKGAKDIGKKFYWLANQLGHGKQKELEQSAFEGEMMVRCHNFWINEDHYRQFLNDDGTHEQPTEPGSNILIRIEVPAMGTKESSPGDFNFTGRDVDWIALAIEKTEIGTAGEDLVIAYEKELLSKSGHKELADKVQKVKDGEGYDILSFFPDGKEKYIEVKTTKAGKESAFPITANEIKFSEQNAGRYHLYRLFNFSKDKRPIEFFEFKGNLNLHFDFDAVVFKARRKSLY